MDDNPKSNLPANLRKVFDDGVGKVLKVRRMGNMVYVLYDAWNECEQRYRGLAHYSMLLYRMRENSDGHIWATLVLGERHSELDDANNSYENDALALLQE